MSNAKEARLPFLLLQRLEKEFFNTVSRFTVLFSGIILMDKSRLLAYYVKQKNRQSM